MASIPSADISAFIGSSSPVERKAAAKAFADAVKIHGCAAVTGHDLSEDDLGTAFATMKKLFDLPYAEKMKAPHPDSFRPHRGYLAKSVEQSGKLGAVYSQSEQEREFLKTALDWKETYDIGHEDNDEQPNIWLPEETFPGFRSFMVAFHARLATIAGAILEALMLGMELSIEECETLRQSHTPVHNQMRLAHYLAMSAEDRKNPSNIRLAPHKDLSSYTLLFQETQSGLEFQNRATGEYMPATPKEGVLYLNIGSIFEHYSNGFYPAAMHRVSIPTGVNGDTVVPERYSVPYFVNDARDAIISPMPSRVRADGMSKYPTTTAQRLVEELLSPVIADKNA